YVLAHRMAGLGTIRIRRKCRSPCLEMGPRRCLPPVESSRETMPIQAAKSRPHPNGTSMPGAGVVHHINNCREHVQKGSTYWMTSVTPAAVMRLAPRGGEWCLRLRKLFAPRSPLRGGYRE